MLIALAACAVTLVGEADGAQHQHTGRPATAFASRREDTSTNWAGYVLAGSGTRYRKVSASWVQPAVRCTTGTKSYSSMWVGIGGNADTSQALEQAGTDADCTSRGTPRYAAWFEIIPAESIDVPLAVSPGDRIEVTVSVVGHRVSFVMRNATRGTTFTKMLYASLVDTTSAEWIVEAPALCNDASQCWTTRLADFGTVAFSNARAESVYGHAGSISDPRWSATSLNLVARTTVLGGPGGVAKSLTHGAAVTSSPSASGRAFSVSYARGSLG